LPASVDLEKETVITGRVVDGAGQAVGGAFVRLLDSSDEFTAEVVASATGDFRFFAAPGVSKELVYVIEARSRNYALEAHMAVLFQQIEKQFHLQFITWCEVGMPSFRGKRLIMVTIPVETGLSQSRAC